MLFLCFDISILISFSLNGDQVNRRLLLPGWTLHFAVSCWLKFAVSMANSRYRAKQQKNEKAT